MLTILSLKKIKEKNASSHQPYSLKEAPYRNPDMSQQPQGTGKFGQQRITVGSTGGSSIDEM